jgi:hypothetical protein
MVFAFFTQTAAADPIDLFQWVFNVDGVLFDSSGGLGSAALPGSFSGTPPATGAQGFISVSFTGAGAHDFVAFYDYELDQLANGFSNEFGAAIGAPPAILSWEIDEPGFVFGDIYDHIQMNSGALDNSNGVPFGSSDDPSVALGWSFVLADGQSATILLMVEEVAPLGGFYLLQRDAGTGTELFFSTSLTITGGGGEPVIPEPGTVILLLSGLGLAIAGGRLMRKP